MGRACLNVHVHKGGVLFSFRKAKNIHFFVMNCQICDNFIFKLFTMFYFTRSYDTAVEQVSVIKQLTELFIVQEDEFQYGSAMLDLAIALDNLVDIHLREDK